MASDVMVSGRYGEVCYVGWVLSCVGVVVSCAMVSGYYVEWCYHEWCYCYGNGAKVSCALVNGCYVEWVSW